MQIVFFKNESYFHKHIGYTFENARTVDLNSKIQDLKELCMWVSAVPFLFFIMFFHRKITGNLLLLAAITLLLIPAHEFCHVLFCLLSGKKVERMSFFPYKLSLVKPIAYVRPAFSAWNKCQAILFIAFPIILLSILPVILAVFYDSLRYWLIFLSLCNLSVSSYDICDIIRGFRTNCRK